MPRRRLDRCEYEELHHLTTLPQSIEKWKNKAFSVKNMEEALQFKILQRTTKDSDRYRQILKIFKEQADRGEREDELSLCVTRDQFHTCLGLLGLFATKEQAYMLFSKYDQNNTGRLNVHEFLAQNRPKDYIGERWHEPGVPDEFEFKGKKQFLRHKLINQPTPPALPVDSVFHLNIERICKIIRSKVTTSHSVGETASIPRQRRELAQLFEYYDTDGRGVVNIKAFERVLHRINCSFSDAHLRMLQQHFNGGYAADGQELIDYVGFIQTVYPDVPTSTSLELTHQHAEQLIKKREEHISKAIEQHLREQQFLKHTYPSATARPKSSHVIQGDFYKKADTSAPLCLSSNFIPPPSPPSSGDISLANSYGVNTQPLSRSATAFAQSYGGRSSLAGTGLGLRSTDELRPISAPAPGQQGWRPIAYSEAHALGVLSRSGPLQSLYPPAPFVTARPAVTVRYSR